MTAHRPTLLEALVASPFRGRTEDIDGTPSGQCWLPFGPGCWRTGVPPRGGEENAEQGDQVAGARHAGRRRGRAASRPVEQLQASEDARRFQPEAEAQAAAEATLVGGVARGMRTFFEEGDAGGRGGSTYCSTSMTSARSGSEAASGIATRYLARCRAARRCRRNQTAGPRHHAAPSCGCGRRAMAAAPSAPQARRARGALSWQAAPTR